MKNYVWKKLTGTLMAVSVAASSVPGLGLTLVKADEKKTLKVAMECGYAPYNWTQPDDSNGAVQISGSSDYAYGYDVMMAQKIADELGYDLEIDDMEFDAILAAVQSGKADFGAAGMTVTEDRLESVDFTDTYANASQVIIVKAD